MDDDAQVFLAELEARHVGPIYCRTYATWYGNNQGVFREYGVFFYWCEGRFYFEDFERTPSILGIAVKSKTPKKPFVRYEGSFASSDVVLTRQSPRALPTGTLTPRKPEDPRGNLLTRCSARWSRWSSSLTVRSTSSIDEPQRVPSCSTA